MSGDVFANSGQLIHQPSASMALCALARCGAAAECRGTAECVRTARCSREQYHMCFAPDPLTIASSSSKSAWSEYGISSSAPLRVRALSSAAQPETYASRTFLPLASRTLPCVGTTTSALPAVAFASYGSQPGNGSRVFINRDELRSRREPRCGIRPAKEHEQSPARVPADSR